MSGRYRHLTSGFILAIKAVRYSCKLNVLKFVMCKHSVKSVICISHIHINIHSKENLYLHRFSFGFILVFVCSGLRDVREITKFCSVHASGVNSPHHTFVDKSDNYGFDEHSSIKYFFTASSF